jgi:hypothetical protein
MMWTNKHYRALIAGLIFAVPMWCGMLATVQAQDVSAPSQVVNDYLSSLTSGDTQRLLTLIDGRMKAGNRQLELNPDSYSRFLQAHYAGVQTTVEDIFPREAKMHARVRFDYPASDSSVIEFVLTQVDGQWKITDEEF